MCRLEFEKTRHLQDLTPLVPRVFEQIEVHGRVGYRMERIDALPLGSSPELGDEEIARTLFETQRILRGLPVNGLFGAVNERIAQRIGGARATLGDVAVRALVLLDSAGGSVSTLCHGDYHPGNLLMHPAGVRVIDWNGAVTGPLEADVAKSLLLMFYAPATLAWGEELYARRREIGRQYLQLLRDARLVDETALGRWLFVRAVEFLALPVPALHVALRPLVDRWAKAETHTVEELRW